MPYLVPGVASGIMPALERAFERQDLLPAGKIYEDDRVRMGG